MAHLRGCLTTDGIEVYHSFPVQGIYCPNTYCITILFDKGVKASISGTPIPSAPNTLLLYRKGDICHFEEEYEGKCLTILFQKEVLFGDTNVVDAVFCGIPYLAPNQYGGGVKQMLPQLSDMANALVHASEETAVTMTRIRVTEMMLHLGLTPSSAAPLCPMGKVAEYLRDHAEEDVSLDKLSQDVGISKFHLLRRFRDEVGMTPHTYLAYVRILKANIGRA